MKIRPDRGWPTALFHSAGGSSAGGRTLGGVDAAAMVAVVSPNLVRSKSSISTARLLGLIPEPNVRA